MSNKKFYGVNALSRLVMELHQHEAVFLKTKKAYGPIPQLDHSVEELLELASALLKLKKRNYSDEAMKEVVGEFTDVLIQLPIILENLEIFGIFDQVKACIPLKINKASAVVDKLKS